MDGLRRFWFTCDPGPGIGVTAFSLDEARGMAENALVYLPGNVITGVVEDVDVDVLDEHLVLPNLGPTSVHGIWFPMLNV
jgi:hypothetical protein